MAVSIFSLLCSNATAFSSLYAHHCGSLVWLFLNYSIRVHTYRYMYPCPTSIDWKYSSFNVIMGVAKPLLFQMGYFTGEYM